MTTRTYIRPTVRNLGTCSAHPSDEAWPAERFGELQRRLPAAEAAMRDRLPGRSIVVVPSRTIDKWEEPAAETQAYEERLLCQLLLLVEPGLHIVYVTSSPIAKEIVGYYLSLLPRELRRDARARLTLLSADDASTRPLAAKLLERPALLAQIRAALPDPALAHVVPYTTTSLERDLALALDLPMYGADPRHHRLGTKSGARELFVAAGVAHPRGEENIASVEDAIAAIARLRAVDPTVGEVVMKLNEGVSGEGNAMVDLRGLPCPGAPDERELIAARIDLMALEAGGVSVADYLAKLDARGGIVEERLIGEEFRSPSVQLEITPAGEVEIVSTHDQLLGGPSGQSYLGCSFPAHEGYATAITALARKVGGRMAALGVVGRSAIDFVVVRDAGGAWRPYAIELNLRKGGTTHPFAALQLLTGGSYMAETATFTTPDGATKHYVATDHLESPHLRRLRTDGLLWATAHRRSLRFNRKLGTGVVFHMLSSLDELGRVGLTAVGDTPEGAWRSYERAQELLTAAATAPRRARRAKSRRKATAR